MTKTRKPYVFHFPPFGGPFEPIRKTEAVNINQGVLVWFLGCHWNRCAHKKTRATLKAENDPTPIHVGKQSVSIQSFKHFTMGLHLSVVVSKPWHEVFLPPSATATWLALEHSGTKLHKQVRNHKRPDDTAEMYSDSYFVCDIFWNRAQCLQDIPCRSEAAYKKPQGLALELPI